jgi:O-methyltransferase
MNGSMKAAAKDDLAMLYVDLLERTLTGVINEDPGYAPTLNPQFYNPYDPKLRLVGKDWPVNALTMIGLARLRNLGELVRTVIEDGIEGDFIETGVWRGGACIYMRALLTVHGIRHRRVWVADSFRGLPPPSPDQYPADAGDPLHKISFLAVSLDQVKANFSKFNLLDDQVKFLSGWFRDTLPAAPIDRLAILRLDGDMYESTMQALDALYDKVSSGGFIIVDDLTLPTCRRAIDDFRLWRGIDDPLQMIDEDSAYWRRA